MNLAADTLATLHGECCFMGTTFFKIFVVVVLHKHNITIQSPLYEVLINITTVKVKTPSPQHL